VVGRADDDRVNVVAGEDLGVVARSEDVGVPQLFAVLEASVIAVGDGDEFDWPWPPAPMSAIWM
jgi:hypothetical protein